MRELLGALGMASEKNQKLPVSDPSKREESYKKGSVLTKNGAYAAISYMASAGFSSPLLIPLFFFPSCIICWEKTFSFFKDISKCQSFLLCLLGEKM